MPWELDKAMAYLAGKDARMAAAIAEIGGIYRSPGESLFTGLMQAIVGQQISLKAADTVWKRLEEKLGGVTPARMARAAVEELQSCGMSFRKVSYLQEAAQAVVSGTLDLEALQTAEDETVIQRLSALRGVGRWTAEMLLIFSLGRPDVMSYDDFGLRKGLCKLYHHRDMPRKRFERYRHRFHPYGTAASLVLWEIAGGRAEKACALPLRGSKGEKA